MPTITISPTYSNGSVLTSAQLDTLVDPITTFVNTTTLDSVNINIDNVISGLSSSQASTVLFQAGLGNTTEATGSATLTTTFASVTSVIAPSTGDYLITVAGRARSATSSTVGSSVWSGYLYGQLYNSTTTTAIGPTFTIGAGLVLNTGTVTIDSRTQDHGFSFSYITSLASSDTVQFRAYRDSDTAVNNSAMLNVYITILRLIQ